MAKRPSTARERVIVALDVPNLAGLEAFLDRLDGRPAFYKVGLELYVAEGARAIEAVRRRGGRVFLDLKLHDIPETVAGAVRSARGLGAELLTIHTAGGAEMMKRAVDAAGDAVTILGVTVLTSLGADDLRADGIVGNPAEAAERRARLAAQAGVPGLVCSPLEVTRLRGAAPSALLVVPGIRPAGAATGDQKRTGTPADTVRAGADYLVVGRPIRDAADPARAFDALVAELEG
jgi:orotidine-5'-phosphate decarboxylase